MKKLEHKQEIAEWYAEQIMQHWSTPYDEIEWLVNNLKEDCYQYIAECYYDHQRENKENNHIRYPNYE